MTILTHNTIAPSKGGSKVNCSHSKWQISTRDRPEDSWGEWRDCEEAEYLAAIDVIYEDGAEQGYNADSALAIWHGTAGRIARVRHVVAEAEPT